MSLIACGGCASRWSGLGRAHCAGCHQTFTTVGAFDHHKLRSVCQDPSERGLELLEGVWSYPAREPVTA